jgi:predicted component of type VI protein secretion system
MEQFLKLPIKFKSFFAEGRIDRVPIKDSIARNLHLLITTVQGENLQNDHYGSEFWDDDYDIHLNSDERSEKIKITLKDQISKFEKRLEQVDIEVNIKQSEVYRQQGTQQRYRLEIIIRGLLVRTKEPFIFKTGFFIGPLMLD